MTDIHTKCRRCLTERTYLTRSEDDVVRIARQMSRAKTTARLAQLKDDLAIAKASREKARSNIERGHDCDNKLSTEHWRRIQGDSA